MADIYDVLKVGEVFYKLLHSTSMSFSPSSLKGCCEVGMRTYMCNHIVMHYANIVTSFSLSPQLC